MSNTFDDRAATWDDDPAKVERGRTVADAVAEAVDLSSDTRVLEYGAGTGLASQALADRVGAITLADSSAGMREVMEGKVAAGTLPEGTRVWDVDLVTDDAPDEQFDLVLTVLALHHIETEDLDTVLERMAALLVPGGHLAVADLEEDVEGEFHKEHDDFTGFHGFRHRDLEGRLQTAGFTDVAFHPCGSVRKHDQDFPMFLAVARPAG